jgi:hypothetical protein
MHTLVETQDLGYVDTHFRRVPSEGGESKLGFGNKIPRSTYGLIGHYRSHKCMEFPSQRHSLGAVVFFWFILILYQGVSGC